MLEVLKVLRAHGINGSVCVFVINPINKAKLFKDSSGNSYKLERFNSAKNIAKFVEISDRTTAEKLKGVVLYQDKDSLPNGQYYKSDLIGRKISVIGSEQLAEITDIVNYGGGELAEVKYDNREILIPFRKEYFKDDLSIDLQTIEMFV